MKDYSKKLSAVNESLTFTNIKGKEYAEVNQRILAFWELFPEGRIETTLLFDDGERCTVGCEVYRDGEERPAATGHAFEVKSGMINSTSYIENCETSAVGRALGMLGIGATSAIASAEEVQNAVKQQEAKPKAKDSKQAAYLARVLELKEQAEGMGIKSEGIYTYIVATFGNVPIDDLSVEDLEKLGKHIGGLIKDKEKQKEKGND